MKDVREMRVTQVSIVEVMECLLKYNCESLEYGRWRKDFISFWQGREKDYIINKGLRIKMVLIVKQQREDNEVSFLKFLKKMVFS